MFLELHLAPGDPAQILLGSMATPAELTTLRGQLGLDQPVLMQYGRWASRAIHGDLGRSIMLRRAVLPELWRRFHATLVLAGGAPLLAFPLGVLVGVLSATRPGSRIDQLSQVVAITGDCLGVGAIVGAPDMYCRFSMTHGKKKDVRGSYCVSSPSTVGTACEATGDAH